MTQCEGTTQRGHRCKHDALPGERACKIHMGKIDRKPTKRTTRPAHRPSRLEDEEFVKTLIGLLAIGVSVEAATAEVNTTPTSFYRWIEKGEDAEALLSEGYELTADEARYREFREQAIRARKRLEIDVTRRLSRIVRDANSEVDVRELIDVLQRISRERWGRQDSVNVHHSGSVDVNVVQRYGETIGEILKGIANDLALSDEQRERWPDIVARNLRRFEQREPA